jgi:hypothetical protein
VEEIAVQAAVLPEGLERLVVAHEGHALLPGQANGLLHGRERGGDRVGHEEHGSAALPGFPGDRPEVAPPHLGERGAVGGGELQDPGLRGELREFGVAPAVVLVLAQHRRDPSAASPHVEGPGDAEEAEVLEQGHRARAQEARDRGAGTHERKKAKDVTLPEGPLVVVTGHDHHESRAIELEIAPDPVGEVRGVLADVGRNHHPDPGFAQDRPEGPLELPWIGVVGGDPQAGGGRFPQAQDDELRRRRGEHDGGPRAGASDDAETDLGGRRDEQDGDRQENGHAPRAGSERRGDHRTTSNSAIQTASA